MKLQKSRNGYYLLRFRIHKKLLTYFQKKAIYKSLETKNLLEAKQKATIIHAKYNEIVKVVDLLSDIQIQQLVNNFVLETLQQDKKDRAINGYGTVVTGGTREETIQTIYFLLDEYQENLANNDYSSVYNVAKQLLEDKNIQYNSDNFKLFQQQMMRGQIEILTEALNRYQGNYNTKYDDVIHKNINPVLPTVSEQIITVNEAFVKFKKWYVKQDVEERTYNTLINRLTNVILPTLEPHRNIKSISMTDIEEVKEFLQTYPNTNRLPYKHMDYNEILNADIPENDYISFSTQNKYLKAVNQFFNYLLKDGIIDRNPADSVKLFDVSGSSWEAFSKEEIQNIFKYFEQLDDRKLIYYTLAYTGLRPSELWKCKISVDSKSNIVYFDLTDKGLNLKTNTSYRKIPLHSKLLELEIDKKLESLQESYKQEALSRYFNETVLKSINLENADKKIMYSFRHTFVTHLMRSDVDKNKVSTLVGHRFEGSNMTDGIYFSGYTLEQLKEAIETLQY